MAQKKKRTRSKRVSRVDTKPTTIGLFDFLDQAVAESLGVPIGDYYRAMESCESEKRFSSLVLGALSEDPKKREQARRVFAMIKIREDLLPGED